MMKNSTLIQGALALAAAGIAFAGGQMAGGAFYDVTSGNPNVDGATIEVPPDDPTTPEDESDTLRIYPPQIGDGPAGIPDEFAWDDSIDAYRGKNKPEKIIDVTHDYPGPPQSYDLERYNENQPGPIYTGQATAF